MDPTPELTIGSTMIDNHGATLVYVPDGEFTMGSYSNSDEQPVHSVDLPAFWIVQTEVTNKMYAACVSAGSCAPPSNTSSYTRDTYYGNSEFDEFPVIFVDWNQAKTFCEWTGNRLPTEAEWEKAARGTDARVYPWGNEFNGSLVNFCDINCKYDWADKYSNDGYADTAPVRNYPDGVSPYGVYNMAGNVWEWVDDWYQSDYYATLGDNVSNPQGPSNGNTRVLRGGAWFGTNEFVRSSNRGWVSPTLSSGFLGIRCARDVSP
jgi:formylglycine-generating enzyme required for sulfatase activity